MRSRILHGDCLTRLRGLPANSVDSLVTDPPAGISFMGKHWDCDKGGRDAWIAWLEGVMRECLRVMKPGAHGLVWALPRTSHWTATALEDAGFEIRDVVTHLFGSGFPKSLDVSKAIDRAAGAKRKVVGTRKLTGKARVLKGGNFDGGYDGKQMTADYALTAPATDAAKRWQGFGTALKPASEHWILVRKPISEKTVAANVLKWGTGALAIDASRIAGIKPQVTQGINSRGSGYRVAKARQMSGPPTQGRWPANLVLSPDAAKELDRQSGTSKSPPIGAMGGGSPNKKVFGKFAGVPHSNGHGDSGGASRYFYVCKPSRRERNAGCEGMPKGAPPASARSKPAAGRKNALGEPRGNHHPTIKPITLMRYLIRMVTPPGGTVLDCFLGSGTTGCAARREGFRFIGIEQDASYVAIAKARIRAAEAVA